MALLRLTTAIFGRYDAEKRTRAAVDFDDLIDKTLSLLSREEVADWVLYQLDGRIDHILVDEAQDTSRARWEIVEEADFGFLLRRRRSQLPADSVRGRRREAVDLWLPGRGPGAARSPWRFL